MAHLGPSLRREKRTERPLRRAAAAGIASVALNAILLWALVVAGAFRLPATAVDRTRVALAPLSSAQWDSNRAVAGSPRAAAPSPPAPMPEERASGRNTRVEKETVSRSAGNYPRVAPRPEAGAEGKTAAVPGAKRDVPRGGEDAGAPGREGAPGDRLALARPQGALRMPELGEGGERGRRGKAGPDLSVSPDALARIAGGPSMDGVGEGLAEGDETWLQSREFKYATFMNRMRREIGQQWYPRVRDAQRQRDPAGSVFFYRERTVVIGLTMDTDGNVKDLSVMQSSNLDFFDRIAVSSVQAAQPFPNPPRGMFHGDGGVRIPFSFTMFPGDRRGMVFWRPPSEP